MLSNNVSLCSILVQVADAVSLEDIQKALGYRAHRDGGDASRELHTAHQTEQRGVTIESSTSARYRGRGSSQGLEHFATKRSIHASDPTLHSAADQTTMEQTVLTNRQPDLPDSRSNTDPPRPLLENSINEQVMNQGGDFPSEIWERESFNPMQLDFLDPMESFNPITVDFNDPMYSFSPAIMDSLMMDSGLA